MKKYKKLFSCLTCMVFVFWLGVITAQAALTITNETTEIWGGHLIKIFDIAFDSSYPSGGESLTLESRGLREIEHVMIFGRGNYHFEYNDAGETVKVFGPAPPIVYEEKQSLADTSSATGFTLDYPAAFIVNVVSDGGTNYPIIYSGTTTLSAGYGCLASPIQDGVRTGVSLSPISWGVTGNTNFLVTYATQAWVDLYDLLVQNELMTGTGVTRHTISGNSIWGFGWAKFGNEPRSQRPVEWADTPNSAEIRVDFGENTGSGATQAYCIVSTGTSSMYVTYLKQPGYGTFLDDRYIGNEDSTSGVSIVTLDRSLLLWLTSGYALDTGNPSLRIVMQDQPVFYQGPFLRTGYSGTLISGTSEIRPDWNFVNSGTTIRNSLSQEYTDQQVWGVENPNVTISHAVYLHGHPWEIPNLQFLEVRNGTDLSRVNNVRVIMIGR